MQESELPPRKLTVQAPAAKAKPEDLIRKKAAEMQVYLTVKPRQGLVARQSAMELELQQAAQITLKYEKNKLQHEMLVAVRNFDERVDKYFP